MLLLIVRAADVELASVRPPVPSVSVLPPSVQLAVPNSSPATLVALVSEGLFVAVFPNTATSDAVGAEPPDQLVPRLKFVLELAHVTLVWACAAGSQPSSTATATPDAAQRRRIARRPATSDLDLLDRLVNLLAFER
jgi:hypothetical protein